MGPFEQPSDYGGCTLRPVIGVAIFLADRMTGSGRKRASVLDVAERISATFTWRSHWRQNPALDKTPLPQLAAPGPSRSPPRRRLDSAKGYCTSVPTNPPRAGMHVIVISCED